MNYSTSADVSRDTDTEYKFMKMPFVILPLSY